VPGHRSAAVCRTLFGLVVVRKNGILVPFDMILLNHRPFFDAVFGLEGFLSSPILCVGVHDIEPGYCFGTETYSTLNDYFHACGLNSVSLDYFDPRAALKYDMNCPVPSSEFGKYKTVIDVGSLEHVFDTRQCLENCLRMLAIGGHYFLHVPVNGYYGHGLHVFNPLGLIDALNRNGCRKVFLRFSTERGDETDDPAQGDCLLWLVVKKENDFEQFESPQQAGWEFAYRFVRNKDAPRPVRLLPRAAFALTINLPALDNKTDYQWYILNLNKEPLLSGVTGASGRGALHLLTLRLNLSSLKPGAYFLLLKNEDTLPLYQKILLMEEFPLLWPLAQ
jgi:hypothetical protein